MSRERIACARCGASIVKPGLPASNPVGYTCFPCKTAAILASQQEDPIAAAQEARAVAYDAWARAENEGNADPSDLDVLYAAYDRACEDVIRLETPG